VESRRCDAGSEETEFQLEDLRFERCLSGLCQGSGDLKLEIGDSRIPQCKWGLAGCFVWAIILPATQNKGKKNMNADKFEI
jgi:hypothetical protein